VDIDSEGLRGTTAALLAHHAPKKRRGRSRGKSEQYRHSKPRRS
jgi:hypothetical protein